MMSRIAMLQSASTSEICKLSPRVFLLPSSEDIQLNLSYKEELLHQGEFLSIVTKIRQWGPALSRNSSQGDQFELMIRKMAIQTANWLVEIRNSDCKYGIFETAASHHLDNICFEIACDLANIGKVFLAHSPFTYRLLPILQYGEYSNRVLANIQINDWELSKEDLNTNTSHWKSRIIANSYSEQSFTFSLLLILRKAVHRGISHLLNAFKILLKLKFKSLGSVHKEQRISPLREIALIFQQKRALKYLEHAERKACIQDIKLSIDIKAPILIFAAHFQPESSSFPIGGKYGNQIDLLIEVRKAHPNAIVFYKEHPHIFRYSVRGSISGVGICRSVEYYKQIEALGIFLISAKDSEELISEKSKQVNMITISGRIAIERALAGLPTVVAGYPWYVGMPGTIKFEDFLVEPLKANEISPRNFETASWVLEAHRRNTIAPGPWSIFRKVLKNGHINDSEYIRDLVALANKL
jgi:hypothetical protein